MEKKDNAKKNEERVWGWVFAGLIVLICCLWLLYWQLTERWIDCQEQRGLFGDSFGGLNALFAGLAFAGVIVALFMQRKELKLQREELTKSTEALQVSSASSKKNLNLQKTIAQVSALDALVRTNLEQVERYERKIAQGGTLAGLGAKELPIKLQKALKNFEIHAGKLKEKEMELENIHSQE